MCLTPYIVKHPGTDIDIEVPCKRCFGCRLARSEEIEFLATFEEKISYQRGYGCSFVTLTYNDNNVPVAVSDLGELNYTLRKKDLQDFLKRLRIDLQRNYSDYRVKMMYCGEYGDSFDRPHYHIIFFGLDNFIADLLCYKHWKSKDDNSIGFVKSLPLKPGGIRYVSKYLIKSKGSAFSDLLRYDSLNLERPFFRRSNYMGLDGIDYYLPKNCNFYKGKLLPNYVRKYLGLNYNSYLRDIKIEASRNGFDNYKDYEEYLKDTYIKNNISRLRSQKIPIDDEMFPNYYFHKFKTMDGV